MAFRALVTALSIALSFDSAAAWSQTVASLLAKHEPAATFTTSAAVVPFSGYKLNYALDAVNKHVTFVVEAETTGWVALGISEAAGMKGADIMMGHVDSSGKAVVGDFHAVSNSRPTKDGCQDWTVHHGEEADGSTMLVFSRKYATGDSNDHPIFADSVKRFVLLLANGPNGSDDASAYSMHASGKKIKYAIDLTAGESVSKPTWAAAKLATAGMSYIDLRASGQSATGAVTKGGRMGSGRGRTYEAPAVDGHPVPQARTTYDDFCWPLSANTGWGDRAKYMVGFQGLPDPQGRTSSPDNVHHVVLSAYDGDDCSGTETTIWVGDDAFYEDLPADVGISFARFKSFHGAFHYDNPTGVAGLKDNSGVRVWFKATKPTHEAGILQLGDGTLQLSRTDGKGGSSPATIPAGRSFWTFTCPAAVTDGWPVTIDEITVFGSILHMHQTGDMMYTEITHKDGTLAKRVNAVQYFDFDHQDPTLVTPYKIKKGDSLTTRCYYNNPGTTSPLRFGQGSDQEMCIDFLYYYPYTAGIKDHCTMPTQAVPFNQAFYGGSYDGTSAITKSSDPGMRAFGVSVGTADAAMCTGGAKVEVGGPSVSPIQSAAPSTSAPTSAAPSTSAAPTSAAPTTSTFVTSTSHGARAAAHTPLVTCTMSCILLMTVLATATAA